MEFYCFGVEIEVIVKPHKIQHPLDRASYYGKLASALRRRRLEARADKLDGDYMKRPEHYDKWWITKDGSLSGPGADRSKLAIR